MRGFEAPVVERIEAARELVARKPRSAEAWGRLGMVLAAHRLDSEAVTCYREAERLDPENGDWPYLAALVDDTAPPARLLEGLERAYGLRPDYAPLSVRLGDAHLDLGDLEDAERAFARALELEPGSSHALVGLADVAAARRDWPTARERLEAAVAARRDHREAYVRLVRVYDALGLPELARGAANDAQSLEGETRLEDPVYERVADYASAALQVVGRARRLIDRGRIDHALEILDAAIEGRDAPEARVQRARARFLRGEDERAREELRAANRLVPGFADEDALLDTFRTERAHDSRAWLQDGTERSGLDFVHDVGDERNFFMPEIMGPGAAWIDYDGDADLDVYLVDALSPNRLFRHNAGGTFTDVSEAAGLDDRGYGMGVAVGDIDNDGDPDVYVTNYGANALFRNRGDGTFEDITERSGTGDAGWGSSAAFFDYDLDGKLDLYVANYVLYDEHYDCHAKTGKREYCGPQDFPGQSDRLYRNLGDGSFEDVSETSGIAGAARAGLGVLATDLDGDHLPDVFVANDADANLLWINRGDGTFEDRALLAGVALNRRGEAESSMGIAYGDLDGDQQPDLFITHLYGETNTAYRAGSGMFDDVTGDFGLTTPSMPLTAFGTVALDIERDGDLDLAIVNGHVGPSGTSSSVTTIEPGSFWNRYALPGQLLLNDGSGRFREAPAESGRFGSVAQVGRALAMGDVDGDGSPDLLSTATADRARIWLTRAPEAGHWLRVRAHDPALRRDVYGARVTVVAGGRPRVGEINPGSSYLSSHEPVAFFGLGDAATYDAIRVVWPGGRETSLPGGAADRTVVAEP